MSTNNRGAVFKVLMVIIVIALLNPIITILSIPMDWLSSVLYSDTTSSPLRLLLFCFLFSVFFILELVILIQFVIPWIVKTMEAIQRRVVRRSR